MLSYLEDTLIRNKGGNDKNQQIGAEMMIENLTQILTSIVINMGSPSRGIPVPNHCRDIYELGITFLYSNNTGERKMIERTFTDILQNPDTDDSSKIIALVFLKNTFAFVSKESGDIVEGFESKPNNISIVNSAKKRLAGKL